MNAKKQALGCLLVIVSASIFGCMPLLVKNIYADGVNSLTVVFLRNLLAVPVGALLAWRQRGTLKIPLRALPSVAAIGITGCCLGPVLLFSSYPFIASGTATVLHFVYPAVVVLGGAMFYREKLTPGNVISVLVCLAGLSLFYTPGEELDWRGVFLALISGVAYAAYILLLAHFRYREVAGFLLNFHVFSINALVMLLVCLVSGGLVLPVTLRGWVLSFLMALAVNVLAVSMFQRGTLLIGGQRAAILSTMEPLTSVFIGILVFQETPTVRTALGSALVLLASVLIVLLGKKEAAPAQEP